MARKRGWKGYWVCLKGTTLLFYPCDSREGRSVEAAPKHLIIVDGAIMQPIPEHPKRDYIFCLSTAFGDAYLFQAPCQVSTSAIYRIGRSTFYWTLNMLKLISFRHQLKSFTLEPIYSELSSLSMQKWKFQQASKNMFFCLFSSLSTFAIFCCLCLQTHIHRWNWKIGSTAFIQLVLQRSHVIAAKRELYTYCRRKFSAWIKQLNRYGDFAVFSLLSFGRLSRVGNNFLLASLIAYSGENETRA